MTTLKSILPHISTGLSVMAAMGAIGAWAFNAYAGALINEEVTQQLRPVLETLDRLERSNSSAATQQAVQQEQLRALGAQTTETNRDIKTILRALGQ